MSHISYMLIAYNKYMKYSLGLDIGTTSVGWSVVNLKKDRIEDLGVRIFERPENPKNGESLAKPRRDARSARRRLRRRRQRLNYLKDFFVKNNILNHERIEYALSPEHNYEYNPYQLREKGLTEQLTPEELFVALYHIAKRRGYKSNRKSVEEKDAEGGRVLKAIAANKDVLSDWNTVGRALNNDQRFAAHKRNKADDYSNSFIREDFLREIKQILAKQQEFYPQLSDSNIHLLLEGDPEHGNDDGIFYQRPFMTDELINKMRGNCPLEKGEKRAPKASYTFEMFRLAQDLAHLCYVMNLDDKIKDSDPEWKKHKIIKAGRNYLTAEQIQLCLDKCLETRKVTYKAIRKVLGYDGDSNFSFAYIRGKKDKGEDNTFAELKFYHDVKKATKDQPDDWQRISRDPDLFDRIGEILTCNKDDVAIANKLSQLDLTEQTVNNLLQLNPSGFGNLSAKAMRKVTPFLLQGNGATYDKAVVAAGYNFNEKLHGDKTKLPPLSEQDAQQITNPVVKRAVSQTIKVINAVVNKYGSPSRIGLECAGDLAKNFKDRNDIKKRQDENAERNQKIVEQLKEWGVVNPTGLQITKFKLMKQQNDKCIYCGKPITVDDMINDKTSCDVDHIIPFSRCGNDSLNNKVLVCSECNREKGNRTPYEQWGNNEQRWHQIETDILSNEKLKGKAKRILAKTPPTEAWRDHAINDTRYISKFLSRYIKDNLAFDDDSLGKQKVILPTGAITSFLRRFWHIPHKDREADCLHHSVDATIIACVDQAVINDCANYSTAFTANQKHIIYKQNQDNEADDSGFTGSKKFMDKLAQITDQSTGYIDDDELRELQESFLPWPQFDKEIRLRESQPKENDTLAIWRDQFRDIYKDQDADFVNSIHPIFVSRMPKRNGTGQTNKETVRSPKTRDNDGKTRSVRMRLQDVKLKDLENSATRDTDPELYQQLKERLEANGDDPKKAFAEPVYKTDKTVDKNGRPISPVSTIKVYSVNPDASGFYVNDGKAYVNNGSMVRLDVYRKTNNKGKIEHFFVPVYVNQIRKGHPEYKPTKILPEPKKGPKDVDDSFTFVCSLYPNDYVICRNAQNQIVKQGYYIQYGIASSATVLRPHWGSGSASDFGAGLKTSTSIQRLDINVLGDNYSWE